MLSQAWWGGEVRLLLEPCLHRSLLGGASAPGCTALATAVMWSELPGLGLLGGGSGEMLGHC